MSRAFRRRALVSGSPECPAPRASTHRATRSPAVAILTSVHDPFDPRIFHKQSLTLAGTGYRVTLLAPHERDEVVDGVRVWGVPPPQSRWGRPLVWGRLLRRALALRADIYHFHDPELLPVGLLISLLTRRPVIYDAHEYYRDEIATREWIPALLRRPAAELVHAIEGAVARHLFAVVAVNEHMAEGFRRRGARAIAIHNYPPLMYFGGVTASQTNGVVAGYVGLLTRDRGLATVWDAGRRLRTLVPGAEVHVIGRVDWAGVGAPIPRDAERWRSEAATRLLGVIPAREVPATLAGLTAGWIPFRPTPNNARTIPLKLLEYMAAGLPVVASDLGFMARIVRDAGCGVLVPPDDAEAHARALAHLFTHPEEARAMGARGRAAVLDRYSWEAESRRLIELYEVAVGSRRRGEGRPAQS